MKVEVEVEMEMEVEAEVKKGTEVAMEMAVKMETTVEPTNGSRSQHLKRARVVGPRTKASPPNRRTPTARAWNNLGSDKSRLYLRCIGSIRANAP